MNQTGDEYGERGKQADAACETIHPIYQIESIGANQQPENSGRVAPPILRGHPDNDQDANAGEVGERSAAELSDQLLPGFKPEQVIDNPSGENDTRRGQQTPDQVEVFA